MKNILLILLFAFFNLSFAQYNSGKVTYKSTYIITENSSNSSPRFKKIENQIGSRINQLEFNLHFNRNSSLFKLNENLTIDKNENLNDMAIVISRGNRLIYSNTKKKIILEQLEAFGKTFLIKSRLNDIKWNLTTETKDIEGYICYKAKGILINKSHKNKDIKFNLTAWYAPELSFNFGPYESSGLPGLVLEFSNGKILVVASKINLSKESITIDKPSKGELVSRNEYNQIGKKAVESIQN